MPRGSAPGERRGGREKGTPNKVTAQAREAFRLMYEGRLKDLDRWIGEIGDGFKVKKLRDDGTEVEVAVGKDPGKAAEIVLRLAEFFVPKLQRLAVDLRAVPLEEIAAELSRREAEEAAGEGVQ